MVASKADYQSALAYRVRQAVVPWIDRVAKAVGQPEYRLRHTEYAGTVHRPLEEVVGVLRAGGFTWGPISLSHQPPIGRSPDGSWTYRPSRLADRQLHVVLYACSPERVDVSAHDEYNWMRHPLKHLAQADIRRSKGARELRRWLDRQGIDFERESRFRRKLARLVARLRGRVPAPG